MLCFNWPLHTSSTATWQACAKWLLSTMERKIFRAQKTCSEVRDIGAQGMWVPARITWSMCHVLTKNHLAAFWKLHLSLPISPPFLPSGPPTLRLSFSSQSGELEKWLLWFGSEASSPHQGPHMKGLVHKLRLLRGNGMLWGGGQAGGLLVLSGKTLKETLWHPFFFLPLATRWQAME